VIVFGGVPYNLVADALLEGSKLVVEGDWLEIPPLGIDGRVQQVGRLLVTIQTWDNTLATAPPRYLMNNTFRN
jgi:small-conductance mechanosensitive channel